MLLGPKVIDGLNCRTYYNLQLNGTSIYHLKKAQARSIMNIMAMENLVIYGSYSTRVPDPITADFSSIGSYKSHDLNDKVDVFMTIVSNQSQMMILSLLSHIGKRDLSKCIHVILYWG